MKFYAMLMNGVLGVQFSWLLREHTTLFSFLIRHACELTIDLLL